MIELVDGGFWTFGNITSLKSGMIVSLRSLLSRLIITFLHLHKHTISFRNISSFVFGKFFHSNCSLVNHWLGKTSRRDWNFIGNSYFTTEMILLHTTFASIRIQSNRYQRHTLCRFRWRIHIFTCFSAILLMVTFTQIIINGFGGTFCFLLRPCLADHSAKGQNNTQAKYKCSTNDSLTMTRIFP